MFNLFKKLNKKQSLIILVSIVFIAFQVYLDLKLPDYMQEITSLLQSSSTKIKDILIYICLFIVSIGIYICNIFIQDKGVGSAYNLYFETNNVSLNIERLGVPAATYLDIYRSIFGFDEKIDVVEEPTFSTKEELFEYDYNITSIDFSGGNGEIAKINNFMSNEKGSKQNKYTGMFEGKNLIFIVA